jgi:hypothetical protein
MAKQTLVPDNVGPSGLAIADAMKTDIGAVVNVSNVSPYLVFAHPAMPAFARIVGAIPDVSEGEPVLMIADPGKPRRILPLAFYLVHGKQFFCQFDTTGKVVYATDDAREGEEKRLKDLIETVLIVDEGHSYSVARCSFKTAKCGAAKAAMVAFAEASNPEKWGAKGEEYKASLNVPVPQLRYLTTVKLATKTSKGNGKPYIEAKGMIRASRVDDWKRIGAWWQDADNQTALKKATEGYRERCEQLLKGTKGE